ncbi:MAG TPA: transglycosylase domain-containing protein, partial [Ktedonobacterales bacterium]|nr:transglycosylase domain-containing protein [Ktedonobacterales bacterium]
MSRAAKIALAVVVLVAASPVWGFEVLYRVFLPANRPELPATTDATPFEMDALWLESGERPATSPDVTPLWALNYFRVYKRGADPRPGVHAVLRIARLWAAQARPPGARVSHLRRALSEVAVMVWLSRTATVDALKRALAEREYFGRDAYGIKAARRAYYGCSASALTTAQVAFLVGLPQSPSWLDPVAHPDRAAKRRQYILKTLAVAGLISEAEEEKAAADNAESTVVPNATACP